MNIKELSAGIRNTVGGDVVLLKSEGIFPKLSVILVGGDESAIIYANTKKRVAEQLGIQVEIDIFPENISQFEIEMHISKKSVDEKVHGILLESPFPKGLNYESALSKVHPMKDIDGLHESNQGKLLNGNFSQALIPATPLACITLIENLVNTISGKNIVVVGRGRTVGKPLANLLIQKGATVTVANSQTNNLSELCQKADIIITATGKSGIITSDMVNENSIIIDAGISTNNEGGITGDVDYANVVKIAKFVTPVPGGVGMITTGIIFQNLIKAISLQKKSSHFDLTVSQFLELASGPSMPGGGGVAALVGALGIAMTSMVASLTKSELLNDKIHEGIRKHIETMKEFYQLDIETFNSYLSAIRLPKDSDEEKIIRSNAIQKSLKNACEVPLQFGESIIDFFSTILECATHGNKNVISDISVGIHLITSSVKAAFEGMDLNIKSIKDVIYIEDILKRKNNILQKLEELGNNGLSIISKR